MSTSQPPQVSEDEASGLEVHPNRTRNPLVIVQDPFIIDNRSLPSEGFGVLKHPAEVSRPNAVKNNTALDAAWVLSSTSSNTTKQQKANDINVAANVLGGSDAAVTAARLAANSLPAMGNGDDAVSAISVSLSPPDSGIAASHATHCMVRSTSSTGPLASVPRVAGTIQLADGLQSDTNALQSIATIRGETLVRGSSASALSNCGQVSVRRTYQWETMFELLMDFAHEMGHCNVPKRSTWNLHNGMEVNLGQWLSDQKKSWLKKVLQTLETTNHFVFFPSSLLPLLFNIYPF
jgi:hypothetical protein